MIIYAVLFFHAAFCSTLSPQSIESLTKKISQIRARDLTPSQIAALKVAKQFSFKPTSCFTFLDPRPSEEELKHTLNEGPEWVSGLLRTTFKPQALSEMHFSIFNFYQRPSPILRDIYQHRTVFKEPFDSSDISPLERRHLKMPQKIIIHNVHEDLKTSTVSFTAQVIYDYGVQKINIVDEPTTDTKSTFDSLLLQMIRHQDMLMSPFYITEEIARLRFYFFNSKSREILTRLKALEDMDPTAPRFQAYLKFKKDFFGQSIYVVQRGFTGLQ